jgi:starvation-inducible DNA-binding protein
VVAERPLAVGAVPDGQAAAVVGQSGVDPVEPGATPVPVAIRLQVARVAGADAGLRERIERLGEIDLTSEDVLIDVARALEKQVRTLRSQV